jgi:anti-sigma factor RsiW
MNDERPGPAGAHASAPELEQYVVGALAPAAQRRLERHAGDCPACARSLAREARLEVELGALWPVMPRPLAEVVPLRGELSSRPAPVARAGRRTRLPAWLHASGAAAAALLALFAGFFADGRPPPDLGALEPSGAALAAACSSHGLPAQEEELGRLCEAAPADAPGLLASWGMCAGPIAVLGAGERCLAPADGTCPPADVR